jgi:hypothetical protein
MPETPVIVTPSERKTSLFNAVVLYMLAFLLTHMLYLFITWLTASFFGIESVFRYFKIEYNTLSSSTLWSVDSLVIMFLSGPFIVTILAGLFSRLHLVSRGDAGMEKLFYLYVFFHGTNYALGSFVAGSITRQETWFALAWLNIPQALMYLIGLIFLVVMIYIGSTKALFIYEASVYPKPNQTINRQYWLLNTLFYPWLISAVFFILLFMPDIQWFTIIILVTPMLFFIPIFTRSALMKDIFENPAEKSVKPYWLIFFLLIFLSAGFRLLFV